MSHFENPFPRLFLMISWAEKPNIDKTIRLTDDRYTRPKRKNQTHGHGQQTVMGPQ